MDAVILLTSIHWWSESLCALITVVVIWQAPQYSEWSCRKWCDWAAYLSHHCSPWAALTAVAMWAYPYTDCENSSNGWVSRETFFLCITVVWVPLPVSESKFFFIPVFFYPGWAIRLIYSFLFFLAHIGSHGWHNIYIQTAFSTLMGHFSL